MIAFSAYIALGDSMSIDLYPAIDLGEPNDTRLGAASLLFSNHDRIWPEYKGKDLSTSLPGILFVNLTEDGATTWDLLEGTYLKYIEKYSDKPVLITLTLGGNDALSLLSVAADEPAKLTQEASNIVERYKKVFATLRSRFSQATIVLNTIYDPSDDSGSMPPYPNFSDKLPFLKYINDQIRELAKTEKTLLADAYQHFLGHGSSASEEDRWYWQNHMIEPSARGASELRALWLATLQSTMGRF